MKVGGGPMVERERDREREKREELTYHESLLHQELPGYLSDG